MKSFVLAGAVALAAAGAAQASTLNLFTDFVGFGDSFSDAGRNVALQPPSLEGRFSDGPTWMEIIGDRFEARGGENFNMALGGATAGPVNASDPAYLAVDAVTPRDPSDPNDIPFIELRNLSAQVTAFEAAGFADRVGSNPLVTIHIGANDFLQNPPATPADALVLFNDIIGNISQGILQTAALDPKFDSFLIATQPDGALVPRNQGLSPAQLAELSFVSQSYNEALAFAMGELSALTSLDIEIFDFGGVLSDIVTEAAAAGLEVATGCTDSVGSPVFDPNNRCLAPGSSAGFLFVDGVHPGSFAHERLGAAALAQLDGRIAPVPLPATGLLLVLGLGGLAALRRRTA